MNTRLNYMDAMRGFSMLLVVFAHVMLTAGCGYTHTVLSTVLMTFRMPLFFFVSGYFAWRAPGAWSRPLIKNVMRRKICAQIIGMWAFTGLLIYTSGKPLLDVLGLYWFTPVLFVMFSIYLLTTLLLRRLHKEKAILPLLLPLTLAAMFLHGKLPYIYTSNLLCYSFFFALGLTARAKNVQYRRLMESDTFRTIAIVLFIASTMLIYSVRLLHWQPEIYWFSRNYITRLSGLAAILILFYQLRDYFSNSSITSRFLRYTGRNTLPVYYLHYFLIPTLPSLYTFFRSGGKTIIIIMVLGAIAVAVTALSLFLARLIRTSRLLDRLLFGAR